MRFAWTGFVWSISRNLSIWDVFDESGTDEAECRNKVASGRRVAACVC